MTRTAHAVAPVTVVEGRAGAGVSTTLASWARRHAADRRVLLTRARRTPEAASSVLVQAFGATELASDVRDALAVDRGADPCRWTRLAARIADWSAARGGVTWVLDDVHLGDRACIEVLASVLGQARPGVLQLALGARTGRIPPALLAACAYRGPVRREAPPVWTEEVIATHLPGLGGERARVLSHVADGRPALVLALAGLPTVELRRLHRIPVADLAAAVAGTAVAGWRAEPPAPATARVGAAAAVVGDDLAFAALGPLSGVDEPGLKAATADLAGDDVLAAGSARIAFTHPVLRAVAYRWVHPVDAVELHRRTAELLASTGSAADLLSRAEHLRVCARAGDESAAEVLTAAAAHVLPVEPAAAVRWSTAALHITADDDRRRRARAHYVDACLAVGSAGAARAVLGPTPCADDADRARQADRMLGDRRATGPSAVVGALYQRESALAVLHRDPAEFSFRGPDDAPGPAMLAFAARVSGGRPGSRSLDEQAEHVAGLLDRLPDSVLRTLLPELAELVWAELAAGYANQAAAQLDRAVPLARGRDHDEAELTVARAGLSAHRGDLARAAELAADVAEFAGRRSLDPLLHKAETVRAAAAATIADGLAHAELAARFDAGAGYQWRQCRHLVSAAVLQRADLPHPALDGLPTLGDGSTSARLACLAAELEVATGRVGRARQRLEHLDGRARGLGPSVRAGVARAGSTLAAAEAGCRTGALDRAIVLAERAMRGFRDTGARLASAECRLQLADLLQRNDDLADAGAQVAVAKREFELCGATDLTERAVALQKRLGARSARTTAGRGFGLSARESEVATLVCRGLTNRAIAEHLVLSVRTVDTHVTRVLAKVGVTSRVALAGLLDVRTPVAG